MTDSTGSTADGAPDLGDEARKLVDAVQEWARRTLPQAAASSGAGQGADGAACQWCPLCQFVSLLRGEQPELAGKVAEAGSAVARAVKALAEAAATHAPPGGRPGATRRPRPGPMPRVQRIRLDRSG